ncbi:hypothetical protein [Acetobacterium woodii]|uniref:Uncharacterized protein n=1 Tax=Acetobacterium woodii (strain ATCC 29683 / DSM 1030 / JCM 2381 / KCTC 1655 / WB1) TaxID=931626 RepID=H6LGK0_ACEWD|nr:hypothetical protein [Acetobacterium woodii]AFA48328.1 hypothetical protein Awo_c15460 [Acetobacterium woodii DSM 1030]
MVALTTAEQVYLEMPGAVKICIDPDWKLYEKINEKGEVEGIAGDLVSLIALTYRSDR